MILDGFFLTANLLPTIAHPGRGGGENQPRMNANERESGGDNGRLILEGIFLTANLR
ncbi:hypothetical protein SBV1_60043 [Verrucomicrobia bacterium]|nr:hypothetical protein SBV1_60043 [Verrucomicrobiota bacterium]